MSKADPTGVWTFRAYCKIHIFSQTNKNRDEDETKNEKLLVERCFKLLSEFTSISIYFYIALRMLRSNGWRMFITKHNAIHVIMLESMRQSQLLSGNIYTFSPVLHSLYCRTNTQSGNLSFLLSSRWLAYWFKLQAQHKVVSDIRVFKHTWYFTRSRKIITRNCLIVGKLAFAIRYHSGRWSSKSLQPQPRLCIRPWWHGSQ